MLPKAADREGGFETRRYGLAIETYLTNRYYARLIDGAKQQDVALLSTR